MSGDNIVRAPTSVIGSLYACIWLRFTQAIGSDGLKIVPNLSPDPNYTGYRSKHEENQRPAAERAKATR